ncbi:AraC family transcriptional regulator [Pseudomonas aeruginosa]|nr:AraC family transcriptional regulator [Pseudomonas aeruginosa]MBG5221769.1 AraC family transcriptional regulator [Pseudomonas aeruginosa]MBG6333321.1 AraC family transcriptional regulator [Pseudomonas aeruginosa]MBH9451295.1 AraC family transcriptional regulator [Pseudomonas aeruginosa]HBO2158410.1 AraC family transcriptional regulator [Pseudomonas aeruginosa]
MSRPLHRHVVQETYVQLLYDYLEGLGCAPEEILGEPWPEPTPERSGVDVEHWDCMLKKAAQALDDPLLGLHVGQTIRARHFGVVGSVILACTTMEAVLQHTQRYLRLVFDVIPMSRRDGEGWFELVWDSSQYLPGPLVSETGTVAMLQFCRDLVRGTVTPLKVDFNHAGPEDTTPYETFFGCPVRFGQPDAVVRYSTQLLDLPLRSPDPVLIALLEQHADRLLAQLPQQNKLVEQLRKTIAKTLRDGEPTIERISTLLRCTPRTLQRRLQSADTTFRRELNLVRHELAEPYLRDYRLQIVDIAMLLGYSEHSAFTRAFKEWGGHTPHEFRRLHVAEQ